MRVSSGFGLAALAVLGCLSAPAAADEPKPPERDTNPEEFPETPAQPNLLLIGGVVTGVWYGAALGTSYLWSDSPGASDLRIPIAGPYMALAKTGCGSAEVGCGTFTVVLRTILTSLAAVGQTGGVLAMVEGAFLPTAASGAGAPRSAAALRLVGEAGGPEVRLEPVSTGAEGFGFGVVGAF